MGLCARRSVDEVPGDVPGWPHAVTTHKATSAWMNQNRRTPVDTTENA